MSGENGTPEQELPTGEPQESPAEPQGPPAPAEQTGALSPGYVAATENSQLLVIFSGNTAAISDIQFKNVDAFQLLAIGSYLEMKGKQMIAAQEAVMAEQARRDSIAVAGNIPPDIPIPGPVAR